MIIIYTNQQQHLHLKDKMDFECVYEAKKHMTDYVFSDK